MKKIKISIFILSLIFAINVKAEESTQTIFNNALDKFDANFKSNLYRTDTLTEFLKKQRMTKTIYTGVFVENNGTTTSFETVTNKNVFAKTVDLKKKITYVNEYGESKFFLDNKELATTTYSDVSYKYVGSTLSETYISSQKILDSKMLNISNLIDIKLKNKGVSDKVRKNALSKIQSSQYIKLNQQESVQDLNTLLGLKKISENPFDEINYKKIESLLFPNLKQILKIKEDKGDSQITLTYNPSPYSNKEATKIFNTRKIVLSIDTDKLADININAIKSITGDIIGRDQNVSNYKQLLKNLYGELEIVVEIDKNTYDVRDIFIPEYEFKYTIDDKKSISYVFMYKISEAITDSSTINLPKKYITPTAIKSLIK